MTKVDLPVGSVACQHQSGIMKVVKSTVDTIEHPQEIIWDAVESQDRIFIQATVRQPVEKIIDDVWMFIMDELEGRNSSWI